MAWYWTWRMRREGALIGSICNHVLSDHPQYFINCQIKIPRMDTDHSALIAVLRLGSVKDHQRYAVRSSVKYPIRPIIILEGNRADRFAGRASRKSRAQIPWPQVLGRRSIGISI
mmetsp:Transcript_6212/g.9410  ORF Transcript_6212/g.9410 Transcript_6212/m.9410 type:complete len:115 (+) Transcript_6212:259-603(+)